MTDYMTNSFKLLMPPKNKWECELVPGVIWYRENAPNAFWRTMQFVVFGFRWRRITKEGNP